MNPTKISIVTACLNQEHTLKESIQSIVAQNYPNLEYIFIDGGSIDSTLAIANQHKQSIAKIISEKDDGQYHAINKGFQKSTGDIMAWLNGDDIYFPWTFSVVNEIFDNFPEVDWVIGLPSFLNKSGHLTDIHSKPASFPRQLIAKGLYDEKRGGYLQQESMFWRRSLWEKVGGLNLNYQYAADFDLWTRFAEHSELTLINTPLAAFRVLPGEQKSSKYYNNYLNEVSVIQKQLGQTKYSLWHTFASINQISRALLRLIIFGNSPIVSYNGDSGQWEQSRYYRSISRAALSHLVLKLTIASR